MRAWQLLLLLVLWLALPAAGLAHEAEAGGESTELTLGVAPARLGAGAARRCSPAPAVVPSPAPASVPSPAPRRLRT